MSPRDRELLTGMGNCFEACGADFEGTIGMVARSRGREPDDVKADLRRLREESGNDPEYHDLRARFPAEFPV